MVAVVPHVRAATEVLRGGGRPPHAPPISLYTGQLTFSLSFHVTSGSFSSCPHIGICRSSWSSGTWFHPKSCPLQLLNSEARLTNWRKRNIRPPLRVTLLEEKRSVIKTKPANKKIGDIGDLFKASWRVCPCLPPPSRLPSLGHD
uniref:Uncharacterized protein n=1 Tax=Rousettus aegyptiacus TaxID=9407 RepID=A0A7J8HRT6_ROUAE|nr:hypothetical protein HJG63_010881 [Rousettus aegyptiacus]